MNLVEYANQELAILEATNTDAVVLEFKDEILKLVEKFGDSKQSGGSAPFVAGAILRVIEKLLSYIPVMPILGIDEEWCDVGWFYQNKRLSTLFKDKERQKPYFINAIVFQSIEDEWVAFTGKVEDVCSQMYIKEFPFEPVTFYIDVKREYDESLEDYYEDNKDNRKYRYRIVDREQLNEALKYYDGFVIRQSRRDEKWN